MGRRAGMAAAVLLTCGLLAGCGAQGPGEALAAAVIGDSAADADLAQYRQLRAEGALDEQTGYVAAGEAAEVHTQQANEVALTFAQNTFLPVTYEVRGAEGAAKKAGAETPGAAAKSTAAAGQTEGATDGTAAAGKTAGATDSAAASGQAGGAADGTAADGQAAQETPGAALSGTVDTAQPVYAQVGGALYGQAAAARHPNSDHYALAGYRLVTYGADGALLDTRDVPASPDGKICDLDSALAGQQLSVLPYGTFTDRVLQLQAFAENDKGEQENLDGAVQWTVNGRETEGGEVRIPGYEDYRVALAYDAKQYFPVSAKTDTEEAAQFFEEQGGGSLTFETAAARGGAAVYTVELHPLLQLSLQFSRGDVQFEEEADAQLLKGDTWSRAGLRYGDKIVFTTRGEVNITGGDAQHVKLETGKVSGGRRYALTMVPREEATPEGERQKTLPAKQSYRAQLTARAQHGTCTYRLRGKDVAAGEITFAEGDELTIIYRLTDEGYTFKDRAGGLAGLLNRWNSQETKKMRLTADMADTTIDPDAQITVIKKEK